MTRFAKFKCTEILVIILFDVTTPITAAYVFFEEDDIEFLEFLENDATASVEVTISWGGETCKEFFLKVLGCDCHGETYGKI